jgi:curli biogenesis system outer membrane secretion channel CsgG
LAAGGTPADLFKLPAAENVTDIAKYRVPGLYGSRINTVASRVSLGSLGGTLLAKSGFSVSVCSYAAATVLAVLMTGCATESHEAVQTEKPAAAGRVYQGARSTISVGKFDNRSTYLRGLFSDGVDRLGGQSKTILVGHLQETGRFNVMERENMEEIAQEARLSGKQQTLKGADFIITGDVVEFGRKETGDSQLFGILGSGKKQVAYSKVTLNVINVLTSQVVYSVSGAGEYALSSREMIGFGSSASYDSTLNGKVLDLAIREAVDHLVEGLEGGAWSAPSAAR